MGSSTYVPLIAFAGLLGGACSSAPELVFIPSSAVEHDLGFAVVTDQAGTPLRLSAPYRYESGRLSGGVAPRLELEVDQRAYLVTLSHAQLEAASRAYATTPFEALGVELEASDGPCAEGRLFDDDRRLLLPVPEAAQVFQVDAGSERLAQVDPGALLSRVRLRLSVPDAGCLSVPPRFEPFFSDPEVISRELGVISVRGLIRLDADRTLMLTSHELVLLDRGGARPLRRLFDLPAVGGKLMRTNSPRPAPSGTPISIFVVAQRELGQGEQLMLGFDLVYDGHETATLVRTTTIGAGNLMDLEVDGEGTVILAAERAPLYTRDPGEVGFRAQTLPGSQSLYSVFLDGPGRVLLGAEQGAYFEGDPGSGRWTRIALDPELAFGVRLRAMARPFADDELWVAGSRGALLRRTEAEPWALVPLAMPRLFRGCHRGDGLACGGTAQYNSAADFVVVPRAGGRAPVFLLLTHACAGVIQLTGDRLCPGVLKVDSLSVVSDPDTQLIHHDVLEDRWITLGNEGATTMIYELDLEPVGG